MKYSKTIINQMLDEILIHLNTIDLEDDKDNSKAFTISEIYSTMKKYDKSFK